MNLWYQINQNHIITPYLHAKLPSGYNHQCLNIRLTDIDDWKYQKQVCQCLPRTCLEAQVHNKISFIMQILKKTSNCKCYEHQWRNQGAGGGHTPKLHNAPRKISWFCPWRACWNILFMPQICTCEKWDLIQTVDPMVFTDGSKKMPNQKSITTNVLHN